MRQGVASRAAIMGMAISVGMARLWVPAVHAQLSPPSRRGKWTTSAISRPNSYA
jgi:hypothetical protein